MFERLAAVPWIDLTVWAGDNPSGHSLKSATPGRYRFRSLPRRAVGPFTLQLGAMGSACQDCDVLILPGAVRELALLPATALATWRGRKVIFWSHGYSKHENWARLALRRTVFGTADAMLFYNNIAANTWVDNGYPEEAAFVALNALDQEPINDARRAWLKPGKLDRFCIERGLPMHRTILFVSRLEPDKRADLLLDALGRLRESVPDAHLAFIGDGSEMSSLRSRASELGITSAVHFVGALYDESALAPWFLSSAAMAYPAAIGLSILHAFGYGLPVVTSDAMEQHNPEIEALRPGANGLLYRDGDIDDLATQLAGLMLDHSTRSTMSENARSTVAGDGFTLDTMVSGIVSAIKFVTGRH